MRKNTHYFKKKTAIILSVVTTALLLTACDSLEYTEEQEDLIANYAANVVLKHDKEYKYNYVTDLAEEETSRFESETQGEETETTVVTDDGNGNGTGSSETVIGSGENAETIAQAFGLPDGILVEYADYSVVGTYPSGDSANNVFVMKAVDNSNLLVVKFRLTNQTSQDVAVNLMQNGKKYKGIVNETKKYNAQLTLLLDALNTYEGTITAGSAQELVLVFQTQLESYDDVRNLSVSVVDDSGTEKVINLK